MDLDGLSAPPPEGVRADCYADVIEAGGLAAALLRVAVDLGLEIGPAESVANEYVLIARIPAQRPGHRDLTVTGSSRRRMFRLANGGEGVECARGHTPDLSEVARAAAAWFAGADPRGMKAAADFIEIPEQAEARAAGSAAGVTDAAWRGILRSWHGLHVLHDEGWREPPVVLALQALLDAAYREPRLRCLYPVTSHYMLWFSRCTDRPYVRAGVGVEPQADGTYLVRRRGAAEVPVVSAAEAVALAVASLPPDCGPAVLTAEEIEA